MTDAELTQRLADIKVEHARGYYLDAIELERDLYRDLARECATFYHEEMGAAMLGHCRRSIVATRELA